MQSYEFDETKYSKRVFTIGGIKTYVYNDSVLPQYMEKMNAKLATLETDKKTALEIPVNVIYFIHGRESSYKFTELAAHKVLLLYEQKNPDAETPVIGVTFDIRNHGERMVTPSANHSWRKGNVTHGIDMLSVIHGTIDDIKLIQDYLPAYLDLEAQLSPRIKRSFGTKIAYNNVISGYSAGAHTAIRFAQKYPENASIIHLVCGCSSLTNLLISRLTKSSEYKNWFYYDYAELPLTDEQKNQYPEAFHQLLKAEDTAIFEDFPFQKVKCFASFGAEDAVVPPLFTQLWINMYCSSNSDSKLKVYENTRHEAPEEMQQDFTDWLTEQWK